MPNQLLRYKPEMELPGLELSASRPTQLIRSSAHEEAQEMGLAAELLETNSPHSLHNFLRQLISNSGLSEASPRHKALYPYLLRIIRMTAPMAGSGLDHRLAAAAARIFRLELEGLSPEDQEFEVARRLVRFAQAAARETIRQSSSHNVKAAVTTALRNVAQRYAPGLSLVLTKPAVISHGDTPRSASNGQWYRKGHQIFVNYG